MSPSFSMSTSELGPLRHPQRRAGDGAVVGEHPHRRVADALGHRRDAQRECGNRRRARPPSVAEAAGRPEVSRGNSFVGRVIRSPLLVSGRGEAHVRPEHGSGGRPRQAGPAGRVISGRAGAHGPTLRPAEAQDARSVRLLRLGARRRAASARRYRSPRNPPSRRGRWRPTPSRPCPAALAQRAFPRSPHGRAPIASTGAIRRGRRCGRPPSRWPRRMSGSSVPEYGAVAVVELLVRLGAGVDGDQRVVAPERAPGRRDDPRERLRWVAALGFRRVDDGGHFVQRALGDGFQERLAGREVHVDGCAHDTRPASYLGHARLLVLAERVDGGVEDARDAAFGVRAAPRPSSLWCCLV